VTDGKNQKDKRKQPAEIHDGDLEAVKGGVGMLLPTDQKLADGTDAPGTVAIVLGDGSVKFVKSSVNPSR
jgi:hypothetical protein